MVEPTHESNDVLCVCRVAPHRIQGRTCVGVCLAHDEQALSSLLFFFLRGPGLLPPPFYTGESKPGQGLF